MLSTIWCWFASFITVAVVIYVFCTAIWMWLERRNTKNPGLGNSQARGYGMDR